MVDPNYELELSRQQVCYRCGKTFSYYLYGSYRFRYRYMLKHKWIDKWYCSWSCYRRGKIEEVLGKKSLCTRDVLFLQSENVNVPMDKVPGYLRKELSDIL